MLVKKQPEGMICKKKPSIVVDTAAFLVPDSILGAREDIAAMDVGPWFSKGSPKRYYLFNKEDSLCFEVVVELDCNDKKVTSAYRNIGTKKTGPLREAISDISSIHCVKRYYSYLKSEPEFQRQIISVSDCSGEDLPARLLHCYFKDGKKRPVRLQPHGNAKQSGKVYNRTQPSTLRAMASLSASQEPRHVYEKTLQAAGGAFSSTTSTQEPRDYQQIYNLKRSNRREGIPSANKSRIDDEMFMVMTQAQEGTSGQEEAFVRDIRFSDCPSGVNYLDQHLVDINRFCVDVPSPSILSIDPTFNLGRFFVTPMTYKNKSIIKSDGSHPIVLGPMLVHHKKTFDTYHFFASNLVSKEKRIRNVHCFGTDDEEALVNAFISEFDEASIHLLCFNHMKQNFKEKWRVVHLPEGTREIISEDIFGSDDKKGLVDALDTAKFDIMVEEKKKKWDELEV